eukprot:4498159-Ditylum_brightwellii.AAC.1
MQKLTSKETGFGANAVEHQEQKDEHFEILEEAMDNLVHTATASTTGMGTLINMNAKLTRKLQTASETIKKLTKENSKLLRLVDKSITGGGGTCGRGFGGTGRGGCGSHGNGGKGTLENQTCYCWSHGYNVRLDHTSLTCPDPKPGHQTAATKDNQMEGYKTKMWENSNSV